MKNNLFLTFLVLLLFNSANAQIKTDSLVLYFPLANNALDLSGNQFNGQVFGAISAADRFNFPANAYQFDGINDYIEIPSNSSTQPNFPFAVSLWVKVDQFNSGFTTLYSSCETPSVYSGFNIKCSPLGVITAQYGDGTGTTASNRKGRNSSPALTLGVWHHVAVSFGSPSEIRIFIDGLDASASYTGSATSMSYTTHSGAFGKNMTPNGTNYFEGSIDEVRLYNDTLSLANAQFLNYQSPCVAQITVTDTVAVMDTLVVVDTVSIHDTVVNISYISSSDTMYINLPQNATPIKLYASATNTELIMNVGANVASMNGYSMSINNSIGQQIFFTPIFNPIYSKNLISFGQLGIFQFYITNNQGQQVVNRKLKLN